MNRQPLPKTDFEYPEPKTNFKGTLHSKTDHPISKTHLKQPH